MRPVTKNSGQGGNERKLSFKARNPEETRAKILKSAIDEFAEYGILGARVERIAKRSDITMRMLYHYFKSKDYLYVYVLENVFGQIEAEERAFELGSCRPEEGMRKLIDFTFDLFQRHPQFIQLAMGENLLKAAYLERSKVAGPLNGPLQELMRQVLKQGREQGVFHDQVDASQLWVSIFSLCWSHLSNRHTLSRASADVSSPEFHDARREHVARMILGYLRQ
jgi:AcrR family transcriptional regulator